MLREVKVEPAASNPTLPVPNPSSSYWRSELSWLDNLRSTPDLPSSCDILIIGAGFSGVSTAYHILKSHSSKSTPAPSVVLLEARSICSGATGRNGGHIKFRPANLPSWVERHGPEKMAEMQAFVRRNVYAVKDVIETEGIQCESQLRRSWDVCLEQKEADEMMEGWAHLKSMRVAGLEDIDVAEKRYIQRTTSMQDAKAALNTTVLSLWPYKLVTQLLSRCLELGAVVHANTPVTSLDSSTTCPCGSGAVTTAATPRGSIRASKVIFATNAYTAGLLPQYTGTITPTKATACHIAVPPGKTAPYLSSTYNIKYGDGKVDYMNPRPDGSIVVGGGNWTYAEQREKWWNVVDDSTLIDEVRPHFDGLMQRYFSGWGESGAYMESLWTGIQGTTPDGLPHVGSVPGRKGQFVLAGFNGGGMAMIFLVAKGVAKMMTDGVDYEDTGLPMMFKTGEKRLSGM